MEATADNPLNQVTRVIVDKLGKQDLDPTLLSGFVKTILDKFKITEPTKRTSVSSNQNNTEKVGNKNSLVEQLSQVYKNLLRDQSYINEYKRFEEKIYNRNSEENKTKEKRYNVFEQIKRAILSTKETQDKKGGTKEGRVKLIEEKTKPQEIILAGITDRASRTLENKFANIFKGLLNNLKGFFDKLQGPKGGFGIIGGALALLLGGLAALVAGLMTDGPFKGLLKILSKVGIQGALKTLEIAAKFFMSGLKSAIMSPISLLRGAAKAIGEVFGKGAFVTLMKPIRAFSGFFTKILGSFGRFFSKAFLTKIPLIGSLISFGFAISRFRSGDVIGGIIDVVSGLVPLLYLTGVGAPFVIPIQLGLDVLNAILDFKAGGATKQASAKKGNILWDWVKKIGLLIYRGIKSLPIIGPAIKAIEEFSAGNYKKGFKQLLYINPIFELLGALLGDKEASGVTKTVASVFRGIGSVLLSLGKWVAKALWKVFTNIPIVGPALKGAQELFAGNYKKAFKQFLYINPAFEMLGALLGDTEVGAVASTAASIAKSIGSMLKSAAKWLKEKLKKVFLNIPVIGPALRGFQELSAGNYKKAFKQFIYIIPAFEMLGAMLGDTEVGGVASTIVRVAKSIGSMLKSAAKWLKEKLWKVFTNMPVIGPLIRGFQELSAGNYKKAFKQFIYINPIFEIFGALLGDTEVGAVAGGTAGVIKNVSQVITDFWKWMKDALWEKISGFVKSVIGGIKDWWNNLSWDPRSWIGMAPDQAQIKETAPIPMKDGGVVPATPGGKTIKVAEAGKDEAIIPIEKYFNSKSLTLNNETLEQIANNTKDTNSEIKTLGTAILRLVSIIDKKTNTQSTTVINANGQSKEITSAAAVAAGNVDPIRIIRQQFLPA